MCNFVLLTAYCSLPTLFLLCSSQIYHPSPWTISRRCILAGVIIGSLVWTRLEGGPWPDRLSLQQ